MRGRSSALLAACVLIASAATPSCSSDSESDSDSGTVALATTLDTAATAPADPPAISEAPTTIGTPATTEAPTTTGTPTTTEAPTTTDTTTTDTPLAVEPLTIDELLELGRPVVLGHAGGEDQHPHSTPFAFAESVAAGVDLLDLDVQLTGDGVLIVQHDDTVDRTTNATGNVADMTYDELNALDNAYWFTVDCVCTDQPDDAYVYRGVRTVDTPPPNGYAADDFVIPRFRDIAERFPNLPLNIEIKGTGEPAITAAKVLAAELNELGRLDSSVVTSFDDSVVTAFGEAAPGAELTPGLGLSSAWVLNRTPLPDGMRILQLPPVFQDIDVLTPEVIAASHGAGYVIWVWPNDRLLENPESYLSFLEQGMDGLNANFPADAVSAVAEFTGT